MDGIIGTIVSVCSTIAGTVLGWILNSQAYKIGKTKIYAVLEERCYAGILSLGGGEVQSPHDRTEYVFRCVAMNSRQIPVILDRFSVEMVLDRHSKPIILSALEPEIEYTDFGKGKIGVQLALKRQMIQPHTLHEFEFKVDYKDPEIKYSRIELIAYNEKNKPCRFLLYNKIKNKKPLT